MLGRERRSEDISVPLPIHRQTSIYERRYPGGRAAALRSDGSVRRRPRPGTAAQGRGSFPETVELLEMNQAKLRAALEQFRRSNRRRRTSIRSISSRRNSTNRGYCGRTTASRRSCRWYGTTSTSGTSRLRWKRERKTSESPHPIRLTWVSDLLSVTSIAIPGVDAVYRRVDASLPGRTRRITNAGSTDLPARRPHWRGLDGATTHVQTVHTRYPRPTGGGKY